jgi:hypothetical protein
MAMYTQFDEKGKIYTKVIKKKKFHSLIQTNLQKIEGFVYVGLEDRLIDELEKHDSFLPVTDAIILDPKGKKEQAAPFIAVRISGIVWIMPLDEEPLQEKS